MGLSRALLLRASRSEGLQRVFPRLPFARRAVSRFMPGEDVENALEAAHRLGGRGIPTVLTELGENVDELARAAETAAHYTEVLERIAAGMLDTEISVKPTHLGLDLDRDQTLANLERLAETGQRLGRWVWIDMEASPYVDLTLDLYRWLRGRFPNVGICLQAYLYRTADDLDELLPLQPGIRLVKGAYREAADVAFPRKRDVDENYLKLAERLLEARSADGARVAFATHDRALIGEIRERASARGVHPAEFEFQMLYGIRTADQRRLVDAGCRVRVLISYGSEWFPWYVRRLAERPANLWFMVRCMLPW